MPRLGKLIHQMAQYQKQWEALADAASASEPSHRESHSGSHGRLTEIRDFGSNPGNLRMLSYLPENVASSPALVVVLHGCTQTASGYNTGTGWSTLADRYGFVLAFPEQQEANNPKRCFNWFQPGDIERDRGEAGSIRQMVERMARDHNVDRSRIFVTGLSAGGAMASAMLAAYPDVFAGGAIIAGLPYRCATSVPEAFECMFQGQTRPAREWGDLVRAASRHTGPWPKISVWHGSADTTVKHMNAGEIIKQWTDVHGLPSSASRHETVDGYPRRVWTNPAGEEVVEEYIITGMAHGTPLATGDGENRYGAAGPFLLEVGISSGYHIAKFWGLTEKSLGAKPAAADRESTRENAEIAQALPGRQQTVKRAASRPEPRKPSPVADIGSVIAKALKAAGLMK